MIWSTQSLQQMHTFALPAIASQFFEINHLKDVKLLVQSKPDWPQLRILGSGSNTLFLSDQHKPIVRMNLKGKSLLSEDQAFCRIKVAAGEIWDDFVAWSIQQEYFGLENLSLIPGTVGACPIQNIGAYGVEAGQFIESVEVFNPLRPEDWLVSKTAQACEFGYRDSKFKHEWSHLMITAVTFKLHKIFRPNLNYAGLTASDSASELRHEVIRLRQSKLPDPQVIPNAGSFFKNPIISKEQFTHLQRQYPTIPGFMIDEGVKIPAAWLLDQCGFKDRWHHEFGCYKLQPLVMIHDSRITNTLSLKRQHFIEWLNEIQSKVASSFGIQLQPEPDLVFD